MRTKVFSIVFMAILLTTVPVLWIDAALSPVNEGLKIKGTASTLQDAPTGNILKKFKKEGGKWVYDQTIDAKWLCRVVMSATVYGNGNVSVAATGAAVRNSSGAHFKTLSPDVTDDRVSSWWLGSAQKTVTATAQKTITTKQESDVGAYKVTGTGYYKQSTGGDGFGISYVAGGSATISGIGSDTVSLPLEDNIPTFDIAVQCDPAEACSGNSSPPPTGSTPPSGGGSTPPSGSNPPQPPTDDTPNCQDCTSHCSSPCSCTNSGTCGGTVVDNTPNCSGCTSDCSYPCSCSGSGTCGGSTMPTPTDNTPNCSGCTSHCSSPCSCSDSGTCNGTVSTPPSGSTPPSSEYQYTFNCGNHRGPWSDNQNHIGYSCSFCNGTFYACDSDASDHRTPVTCSSCGSTNNFECQSSCVECGASL